MPCNEDFLDALVDQMMIDFSPEGSLAQRKSGIVVFRGQEVYYRKARRDMLRIIVGNGEPMELPIF